MTTGETAEHERIRRGFVGFVRRVLAECSLGSVRRELANRAAPPRDRSTNAAETAGSIALGSRSAATRPARSAPCAGA